MVKSLQLQAEMIEKVGVCEVDVTRGSEDGAPVGAGNYQVNRVLALVNAAQDATISIANGVCRSVGVGILAVGQVTLDQFHHPLGLRANMDIASAFHAHGTLPPHCVVTAFRDTLTRENAEQTAPSALDYPCIRSIYPIQIRASVKASTPSCAEVESAIDVVMKTYAHHRVPVSVGGQLHDRASCRSYWQVLEPAHQTGVVVPPEAVVHCSSSVH